MLSITENLKFQIKNLEARLNADISEKEKLQVQKLITENKILLETTYRDLNKRNGMTLREFEAMVEAMPVQPKRSTGISLIDDIFDGGFEEAMFINLVGESGAGKSTLALEILLNIAEYTPSVFIGLEMGAKLTLNKIKQYGIKETHRDNLIIDMQSRNIEELKREVNLYANDGIKFFVIDSRMKLEADGFSDDHKKISYISGELSKLTQQLGIIIILINQISEQDLRNGRISLKGSGDQRYDSDIILAYRKHKKNPAFRELVIDKNRQNGKEGIVIETRLQNGRTVAVASYDDINISPKEIPFNESL